MPTPNDMGAHASLKCLAVQILVEAARCRLMDASVRSENGSQSSEFRGPWQLFPPSVAVINNGVARVGTRRAHTCGNPVSRRELNRSHDVLSGCASDERGGLAHRVKVPHQATHLLIPAVVRADHLARHTLAQLLEETEVQYRCNPSSLERRVARFLAFDASHVHAKPTKILAPSSSGCCSAKKQAAPTDDLELGVFFIIRGNRLHFVT